MKFRLTLSLVALASGSAPALAQPFADLDAIDRQVAAFIGINPAQMAGAFAPVDRRLRLNACARPLSLAWNGNRRETVLVQCPIAGGWKLYVPIFMASAGTMVAPPVVMKGDAVTVTVKGNGFSVSQAGEALDAGAIGEWIRVKIGKDGEVRAQILRPGAVGMDLP